MKNILGVCVFLIVCALGLNTAIAGVTTVDLYNQFPNAQGQNGFYAYGYQAGRAVPYRQLTREDSYYFSTPEQPYHIPYVRRSVSPWLVMAPSLQSGTVYGAENAVLAWRAPKSNTSAISGQFSLLAGGAVTVYIRKNQTVLWSALINVAGPAAFNLQNVSLAATDTLYFGVDAGANDINDTTQLSGQIRYTPRPTNVGAYLLLLLN